jgi:hypothetical protein
MTHLFLDSISYGFGLFYPLSDKLYGFLSFKFIEQSFIGENLFFINISLEVLIIFATLLVLISLLKKIKKNQLILIGMVFFLIWTGLTTFLYFYNLQTYRAPGNPNFEDIDNDGIINEKDFDIDNDNIRNIDDIDANDNQIKNPDDLADIISEMRGIRFYSSEGPWHQITRRIGFFNETDHLVYGLRFVGIFLKEEMIKDYKENPSNYELPSSDENFTASIKNIYTFFDNNDKILDSQEGLQPGDIIIFGDFEALGIVKELEDNQVNVLYLDSDHRSDFYSLQNVIDWAGEIRAVIRLN